MGPIALIYDDDAYVVPPAGLMGRQVAGGAFLDAYLSHGRWEELVALVARGGGAESLKRICAEHPSSRSRRRRLRVVEEADFLESFASSPPSRLIHAPGPPEARRARARRHLGGDGFSLCGVTHTLATAAAMGRLRDLLTAPFRPHDAPICTSRAVEATVRSVVGEHVAYLADRFGGSPPLGVHLATIPLGVDTDHHRPSTGGGRLARRWVSATRSRSSASAACRTTPRRTRSRTTGGGASRPGRRAGRSCGDGRPRPGSPRRSAAGRPCSRPGSRWSSSTGPIPVACEHARHAADAIAMLADSVQETFGLAVVEAMARGLPVVASDWDGHKDTIVDGETGLLVPTWMVSGASPDAGARLDLGAADYDLYLAELSEVVAVDVGSTAAAFARLIDHAATRASMGESGRRRAVEVLTIARYEELWSWQEAERSARAAIGSPSIGGRIGPAERTFSAYPTAWLARERPLVAGPEAVDRLAALLDEPLTYHAADRRMADPILLSALLDPAAGARSVGELAESLGTLGIEAGRALATIAWLIKYDLLGRVPSSVDRDRDMDDISDS